MAASRFEGDRAGVYARRFLEPHWSAVDYSEGPIAFLDGFERLPIPVRHLLATYLCDAEVCNGGFHQFFSNSTGVLAPEALEGFRALGLHPLGDLLESAIDQLGQPYPRDRSDRVDVLGTIELPGEKRQEWDPFFDLDDRYYAAKRSVPFLQTLDRFARLTTGASEA